MATKKGWGARRGGERGRVWRREKDRRLGEWEKKCVRKREGRQRVDIEGERVCAVEGREGDEEGEGIIK